MKTTWSASMILAIVTGVLLWPNLGAADGPFDYHTVMPCRLADTRNANGPAGGPILEHGVTRPFPAQGTCGIPVGAKAVTINVTAVTPSGPGHLRLFPSGISVPTVATLNYGPRDVVVGNGAIVSLAEQSVEALDLSVYPVVVGGGGTVHVVMDVTGYFQ
jgi:hypothetical protein